jgi:hypothetical protein
LRRLERVAVRVDRLADVLLLRIRLVPAVQLALEIAAVVIATRGNLLDRLEGSA